MSCRSPGVPIRSTCPRVLDAAALQAIQTSVATSATSAAAPARLERRSKLRTHGAAPSEGPTYRQQTMGQMQPMVQSKILSPIHLLKQNTVHNPQYIYQERINRTLARLARGGFKSLLHISQASCACSLTQRTRDGKTGAEPWALGFLGRSRICGS